MTRTRRTTGFVLPFGGLAVAIGAAVLVAACGGGGDAGALTNGQAVTSGQTDQHDPSATTSGSTASPTDLPKGITAKEYFTESVQPSLAKTCGGCHAAGPAPVWIAPQDIEKSYSLQFQRGYVSQTSTILHQGVHNGGAAPALTGDQAKAYSTWIALELKERGNKTPDSTLQKLGACLDQTKFNAIGWDKLVTTPRTADNNPGKETEDTDTCTGCNNVQCSSCHSDDPATGFLMAMGNDVLPADHTFTDMKTTAPPYMQKYFGLDTGGNPTPSNAIKQKSDATVNTAKAYQHPMFVLPPAMSTALDAFVADAIAKYNAGTCSK
jgi:hypothetical protein